MPMNEAQYQRYLVKKIEELIPGCDIIKNDPRHNQGIPDLLILHNDKWAMLEVKASANANIQPNQVFYIGKYRDMSFASFINPENEEDVLHELQLALGSARETRLSKS
jgi:hypothetical protein